MIRENFIRAVNKAYHEEGADIYDLTHPEILTDERENWIKISEYIKKNKSEAGRPIRLLDAGTGTGFVPSQLSSILGPEDEFVLSDISNAMLERASKMLCACGMKAKLKFVCSAVEDLNLESGNYDVVTFNSVLHHFPDPWTVLNRVSKGLNSGGIIVISHEPNIRHYKHPLVGGLNRTLYVMQQLKYRLSGSSSGIDPLIERTNKRLIQNGIIDTPLSVEEMEATVDIHSPTGGRKVRSDRGFDPEKLIKEHFGGFELLYLNTYRYFKKISSQKLRLLGPIPRLFEKKFPKAGMLFVLIVRKP